MRDEAADVRRRENFGICVSGGGIRAASFGLGALQSIQERTKLVAGQAPAGYISAVSGGSYIVGAIAMLKSDYSEAPRRKTKWARLRASCDGVRTWSDRLKPTWTKSHSTGEELPLGDKSEAMSIGDPFGPGTPEVEHLRRYARYLLGGGGSVNMVLELFIRLAVNVTIIGLIVFVPALVLGNFLGIRDEFGTADSEGDDLNLSPFVLPFRIGLALFGLAVFRLLVMIVSMRSPASPGYERTMRRVSLLAVGGISVAAASFLIPAIFELIVHLISEPIKGQLVSGDASREEVANLQLLGLLSGIASITTVMLGLLSANAGTPQGEKFRARAARFGVRIGRFVLTIVATVSVPILLGVTAMLALYLGSTNSVFRGDENGTKWTLVLLLLLTILLLVVVNGDPVKWSLYPFYKRRLMRCFCVRRFKYDDDPLARSSAKAWNDENIAGASQVVWRAEERPYNRRYLLSASQPKDIPRVLICAAANVSEFGESPAGQGVLPFIFSAGGVGFPPGIVLPPRQAAFKTVDLEAAFARDRSTVKPKSWSPIRRVQIFFRGSPDASYLTMPSAIATAGAAVSPMMGKMTMAPFRALFALFNIRLGIWLPNPANSEIEAQVDQRAKLSLLSRRRPLAIFRELFGRQALARRLLYVSDGGHYENLGLVELMRRRCTRIICIDASGDRPGTASTLSEAMLLAQGEFNVRWLEEEGSNYLVAFSLQEKVSTRRDRPTVQSTWTRIPFKYDDTPEDGELIVLKIGVSADTVPHLQDFQLRNKRFPYDSTGNQLFRADRFDAYVALGRDTAEQALSVIAADWGFPDASDLGVSPAC